MTRPIVSASSTTSWRGSKNQQNKDSSEKSTPANSQPTSGIQQNLFKTNPKPSTPKSAINDELEELKRMQGALKRVPSGGSNSGAASLASITPSGPGPASRQSPRQQFGGNNNTTPSPPGSKKPTGSPPRQSPGASAPGRSSSACPSMKRKDVADLPEIRKATPPGQAGTSSNRGVNEEKFAGIGTYLGEVNNGVRYGKGTFKWDNGDVYEGNWANDAMNGYGEYKWSNGQKYAGDWIRGQPHGKGYLTWAWDLPTNQVQKAEDGMPVSGGRYTGQFLAGMRHGTGIEMQPGKGVFKGEWVEDIRDGAGSYKWPNGDHFIGQWGGDKREGKGMFQWANGTKFEGVFKQDAPIEGRLFEQDGNVYHVTYDGTTALEEGAQPVSKTPAYGAPQLSPVTSPNINLSQSMSAMPDFSRSINITPADPFFGASPRPPPAGASIDASRILAPESPMLARAAPPPPSSAREASDVPLPPMPTSSLMSSSRFTSFRRDEFSPVPAQAPALYSSLPLTPTLPKAPVQTVPTALPNSSAHISLGYQAALPIPTQSPPVTTYVPYNPPTPSRFAVEEVSDVPLGLEVVMPPPSETVVRAVPSPPMEAKAPSPPLSAMVQSIPSPPLSAMVQSIPSPPLSARVQTLPPPPLSARVQTLPPPPREEVRRVVRQEAAAVRAAAPPPPPPQHMQITEYRPPVSRVTTSKSEYVEAGIGVLLEQHRDGLILVKTIAPDGPAARNGILQIGDQVLEIDGRNTKGMNVKDTKQLISGQELTTVTLRIKPKSGGEHRTLSIVRRRIGAQSAAVERRESAPVTRTIAEAAPAPVSRSIQASRSVQERVAAPPPASPAVTRESDERLYQSGLKVHAPPPMMTLETVRGGTVTASQPASPPATIQLPVSRTLPPTSAPLSRAAPPPVRAPEVREAREVRTVAAPAPSPVVLPAREQPRVVEATRVVSSPQSSSRTLGDGTYMTFEGSYKTFDGSFLEKKYADPGTYRTVDGQMRTFDGSTRSLSDLDMYRSSPALVTQTLPPSGFASQPSYAAQALEAYSASARSTSPTVSLAPTRSIASVQDPSYQSLRSMVASIQAPTVAPASYAAPTFGRSIPAAIPQHAATDPKLRTVV